ncbi:MAG: sulfotransferase domain-containing protein [Phycisphaerales bacterium]
MANVRDDVLRQGAVYTPVYMAAQWFDQQVTPRPHHRHLVVIRDLRDAAVSWYFSMKYSHGVINDAVAESRRTLDDLSMEEGLLFVIRERLRGMADIQRSWLHKPECRKLIIRYEDLVADEVGQFNQIFDFAGFDSDIVVRRVAIEAESFQARTGRARGVESVREHHRKGVAGDWQNHFTDRVKDAFKSMYGQTLIETGYESDLNW